MPVRMKQEQIDALAQMGMRPTAEIVAERKAEAAAAHAKKKGRGKLPRTGKGGMNKLEAAYHDHLQGRLDRGEILAFWFQPFSLNLGEHPDDEAESDDPPGEGEDAGKKRQRGRYTPDFLVQESDGFLEIHEVKGSFWNDAALVRIKWAATKYHVFTFRVCTRKRKSDPWQFEEITG